MTLQDIEHLMKIGKYKEALDEINEQINNNEIKNNEKRLIQLLIHKSLTLGTLGNLDGAEKEAQKAIQLGISNDFTEELIEAYYAKADVDLKKRNYEQLKNTISQGEKMIEQFSQTDPDIEESQAYANLLRIKGIFVFSNEGDLQESLELFTQCYNIFEKHNLTDAKIRPLSNIGVIHYFLGEIDTALKKIKECLELIEIHESTNSFNYVANNNNLGLIYYAKAEPKKALKYFNRSLKVSKEIGNIQYIALNYHNLIRVRIFQNEIEKAQEVLTKFTEIQKKEENTYADLIYRLTKALVLKSVTRYKEKGKAQELLEEIIDADVQIDYQFTQLAMFNLTELLIEELEIFGDNKILKEIYDILQQLKKIGKENRSLSVLAESYLLESRLELLYGNINHAKELLNQAIITSEERGMENLAATISLELDELVEHEGFWEKLAEKDIPISEKITNTKIQNLLDKIINNQLAYNQIEQEQPVIFLIINNAGLPIYFKNFRSSEDKTSSPNEMLISNFLTAIDSFGRETFKTQHFVERIQFKDQMILTQNINEIFFIYSFKGQSYTAGKKLQNLLDILMDVKDINEAIFNFHGSINNKIQEKIEAFVNQVFGDTLSE